MAKTKKVEKIGYIEINPLMMTNAIRIYMHWKQLDGEVRTISTRGVNFPGELSELFACYVLGYLWKKDGEGDAFDPKTNRIIEMKGSGSDGDDLSSFSPDENFDELVFIKANKDEDAIYIWNTGVNSDELKQIKVNKKQTLADKQAEGNRPRFSVQKKIIAAKGLTPDYKFDILSREIIDLKKK